VGKDGPDAAGDAGVGTEKRDLHTLS